MSGRRDAEALEAVLEHRFRDPALLELALAHPSFAYESDGTRGNERLEFLGDAVLDLVVAELLFEAHPQWNEGQLTRARAALVNQRALAELARELELGRFVRLGRTEQLSDGARKDSILANCLEALAGALYLDGGLAGVRRFAARLFGAAVSEGSLALRRDPKTGLQEWAHAEHGLTPTYRTVADSGVDADERRFTVEVRVGGRTLGSGCGRSKRVAERAAAAQALARLAEDGGD